MIYIKICSNIHICMYVHIESTGYFLYFKILSQAFLFLIILDIPVSVLFFSYESIKSKFDYH